jgi:(S)-3,5-dihydroxyphenylglycine transaminase
MNQDPRPTPAALQIPAQRLRAALANPRLEVMNFLNQVAMRFPEALSFAPGRPPEPLFGLAGTLPFIEEFMRHGDLRGLHQPLRHGLDALGQYGRTNGIIGGLIADLLARDEGICVAAEDIVVTVGAQEAMCLCLSVLCGNPGDVALSIEPAYIGWSGAAQVLGIETAGVPAGEHGVDLPALERVVAQLARQGKTARLLYWSSDYANPTGLTLPLAQRRQLLEAAERLDLLLVEDSAYNYFCYDDQPLPPLKSLPGGERVLFIGSFAKTVYPGLRVGFIAAGQTVGRAGQATRLADEISKAKSLLTVNTSPLMQALVGGLLLAHGGSLRQFVQPRVQALRANRDAMLAALQASFPRDDAAGEGISWNRPAGGFFLTLTLPRAVAQEDLLDCARDHAVTWTPMAYFEFGQQVSHQIRLSFSYLTPPEIEAGIGRLARWVARGVSASSSVPMSNGGPPAANAAEPSSAPTDPVVAAGRTPMVAGDDV